MNPTRYTTLISADQLRELRAATQPPIVIDASFDLADPDAGYQGWLAAHLPGSVYLHLDRDLAGPKTGTNGRHPLPDPAGFATLLTRIGVGPQTQVVALDAQGGVYAARVWWLLRWAGHPAVAVLDGGISAWKRAGGELVGAPSLKDVDNAADRAHRIDDPAIATTFETPHAPVAEAAESADARRTAAAPAACPVVDASAVLAGLGRLRVIDARAAERFRGEVEPLDAVAGHIPGALNRFWKENLGADGHWKTPQQLHAEFMPLLGLHTPGEVVHQCGSGVTACHNLLAMEHAGLSGSALYAGSWSEWSADPARPVARG